MSLSNACFLLLSLRCGMHILCVIIVKQLLLTRERERGGEREREQLM